MDDPQFVTDALVTPCREAPHHARDAFPLDTQIVVFGIIPDEYIAHLVGAHPVGRTSYFPELQALP